MHRPGSTNGTSDATRDELYERAKQRDIAGRSSMTKAELREALGEADRGDQAASRVEDFRKLAEAAGRGEFVMLPRALAGNDRRMHVRQTLREDHTTRIAGKAEGTAAKFDKLAGSLYSFFRGTCLLFYRDMAGDDRWYPTVLTLGDVHPANFGVMPNANNVPIFGVNDFDEAYYAPFTWDLKRGAVGFMIACDELAGYDGKKQRKIAGKFVEGYIEGMRRFSDEAEERGHEVRIDNAPKLIRKLIENAQCSREEWLEDRYSDEFKRGFRASDELVPVSDRRDEFQGYLDQLVDRHDIDVPARAGRMKVKDVAMRRGQGTASLGLPRYYLLVEGPEADGTDDLILEFKRARRSALQGLVPPSPYQVTDPGERISHAQTVQLVRGDRFYGWVEIDGRVFMSRERAPFRDDVDLEDLSKKQWKHYAFICGTSLAHAHALSDETGKLTYDIEPTILAAIGRENLFVDDILRFAEESADRVRRDHELFKLDHEMKAFEAIDVAYE